MPLQMSSKFLDNERNSKIKLQEPLVVCKKINKDNIGVNVARGIKDEDSTILNLLDGINYLETETRIVETSQPAKNKITKTNLKQSNFSPGRSQAAKLKQNQIVTKSATKTVNHQNNQQNQIVTATIAKNKNIEGFIKNNSNKKSQATLNHHIKEIIPLQKVQPALKKQLTENLQQVQQDFLNQKQPTQNNLISQMKSGQNIVLLTKQYNKANLKVKQASTLETQQTLNSGYSSIKLTANANLTEEIKSNSLDQQPLKSIFSPNGKHHHSIKAEKNILKKLTSADKENIQSQSNQKKFQVQILAPSKAAHTPLKVIPVDLIQKLRLEVQKQVKKISDQNDTKKQQLSSGKKHQSSIISFEARQLMRQKKLKQQEVIQNQLQKQQAETDLLRQQRAELRNYQDQEMRDIHKNTEMIKKSLKSSPSDKIKQIKGSKSTATLQKSQNFAQQMIEINLKASAKQLQRPLSSQNFIDDKYSTHNIRASHTAMIKEDNSSKKKKGLILLQDYLKDLKQKKNCDMPRQSTQTKAQLGDKDKKSSRVSEFLKEQKIKRQTDKQNILETEQMRLSKKQQQLNSLNKIQQMQVEGFKQKQRVQSEKRLNTKLHEKKKKRSGSTVQKLKINVLQSGKRVSNIFLSPKKYSQSCVRKSRDLIQSPLMQFRTSNDTKLRASDLQLAGNQISQIDPLSTHQLSQNSLASSQTFYQSLQHLQATQLRSSVDRQANFSNYPLQQWQPQKDAGKFHPSNSQNNFRSIDKLMVNTQIQKQSMASNLNNNQMLQELTKMRKNIESNLNLDKKKKKTLIVKVKKQVVKEQLADKQKKLKNLNMPLRTSKSVKHIESEQMIQTNKITNIPQVNIQMPLYNEKNSQNQQIFKQKILDKLQEIKNKVKQPLTNEQQQQVSQQDKMLQSIFQNPLVRGQALEEKKQATNKKPQSYDKQQLKQLIQISQDPLQIKQSALKTIEPIKYENTTILLQKIQCENKEQNKEHQKMLKEQKKYKAILFIQRQFRGHLCRRLLKDKLKTDAILRIVKQKQDLKIKKQSQQIDDKEVLSYKPSRDKQLSIDPQVEVNVIYQNIPQGTPRDNQESIISMSSPFDLNMLQNEFYRPSDQNKNIEQQFSIFKTPSIYQNESQQADTNGKLFNYQPIRHFSDKEYINNYENEIMVFTPQQPPRKDSNQSFSNESQNSKRSKYPLQEDSPFVYETKLNSQDKQDIEILEVYPPIEPSSQLQHQTIPSSSTISPEKQNYNINFERQGISSKDQNTERIVIIQNEFFDTSDKKWDKSEIDKNEKSTSQQLQFEEQDSDQQLQEFKELQQHSQQKSILKVLSSEKNNDKGSAYERTLPKPKLSNSSIIDQNESQLQNQFPAKSSFIENFFRKNEGSKNQISYQTSNRDDSFMSSQSNQSIFEKNSFQAFSKDKITKMYKAESEIESMINELNNVLNFKIEVKHQKLQDLNFTQRTYDRKKIKLDRWVEKEKKEIQITQKHFSQGVTRLSSILEHFVKDKSRIKQALGQAKNQQNMSQNESLNNVLKEEVNILEEIKNDGKTIKRLSEVVIDSFLTQQNQQNPADDDSVMSVKVVETFHQPLTDESKQKGGQTFEYHKQDIFEPLNPVITHVQENQIDVEDEDQYIQINANTSPVILEFEIAIPSDHLDIEAIQIFEPKSEEQEGCILIDDKQKHVLSNYKEPLQTDFRPIIGQNNIGESKKSLNELNLYKDDMTDQLVEQILNEILLKELKNKLFPQRVFIPKTATDLLCENGSDKEEADKEHHTVTEELLENKKRQGIQTNLLQVSVYMEEVFEKIKQEKEVLTVVLDNIAMPLFKDPLQILAHLQNSYIEPNENQPNPIIFQQSVLSVDLYLDIEKDRRGMSISQMKDSFEESNTMSFIAEMENIHNKAIFDAINESLDGFRPYGLKGPPLPWSKQSKTLTFKFGKEETVDYLLQKVKFKLLEWGNMNAGMVGFDGMDDRDKYQLEMMREDRLARILISEAEENEPLWTDYEFEDTQAKLDLADLILNTLCGETVTLLQDLQLKKIEDELIATQQQQNNSQV